MEANHGRLFFRCSREAMFRMWTPRGIPAKVLVPAGIRVPTLRVPATQQPVVPQ